MAEKNFIPTIVAPEVLEAEALRREARMRDAFKKVKSYYDYNYTDFVDNDFEPFYWKKADGVRGMLGEANMQTRTNGGISDAEAFAHFMRKVQQKTRPEKGRRGDLRRAVDALQGSDALTVDPETQKVVFNESYQSPFRKKFLNKK